MTSRITSIAGRIRANWALVLAAVLVAGSLLIVNLTGPDAGDLDTHPGQFVGLPYLDRDVTKGANSASLRFPRGVLRIEVGRPVSTADNGTGSDGYLAPDDGSLIGIDSSLQTVIPYSIPRASAATAPEPVVEFTIVADGQRYPVRAAPDAIGGVRGVLAVAGRPRDVRVEATMDGIRQSVRPSTGARDPGRAAGLYRPGESKETSLQLACTGRRITAGYRLTRDDDPRYCEVTGVARTAYVAGLGWAAPNRTWLIVVLTVARYLQVQRVTGPGAGRQYRDVPGDDDLTVSFDGRRTSGSPRVNGGNGLGSNNVVAVGQVDEGAAPVSVGIVSTFHRLRDRSGTYDAAAPLAPDVSLTWTVRLP